MVHWLTHSSIHLIFEPLHHWLIDSLIQWFTASLIHWFTAPLVHWLTGPFSHWFIVSLARCFTESLSRWTIDALFHWFIEFTHWFIDSLVHRFIASSRHSFSCAVILSNLFIDIPTTICSVVDAPRSFNTSLLLHRKSFPIGHWFPRVMSYFWNFRPGVCQALPGTILHMICVCFQQVVEIAMNGVSSHKRLNQRWVHPRLHCICLAPKPFSSSRIAVRVWKLERVVAAGCQKTIHITFEELLTSNERMAASLLQSWLT